MELNKKFNIKDVACCQTCKHYEYIDSMCGLLEVKYGDRWTDLKVVDTTCDFYENFRNWHAPTANGYRIRKEKLGDVDPATLVRLRDKS